MRPRALIRGVGALTVCLFLCSCAAPSLKTRKVSLSYSSYLIGLLNDRTGDVEEAIVHYQRTRELDQESPALPQQLGFDYIRLKDFPKAVAEFEKAVRLDPDDFNARYLLALLYVQLGDFRKATDQYQRLIEDSPDDRSQRAQLRHILSQLYFLEGDLAAAAKTSAEALRENPSDAQALYLTAIIAGERGESDQAVEQLKEFLKVYPDHTDAMNSLAYLYAELETELTAALDLADKAVAERPANAAYVDTLGWVYFKMGDTDQAIAHLLQASRLMPNPVILNHLAEAYEKKGEKALARGAWEASLRLDPFQKDVRRRLKGL